MKTSAVLQVALIGNPNTGKSTLFNALSGMRQRVGNYPGVTVDKKVGNVLLNDISVELIDLPGVYSLSPQSPDELLTIVALFVVIVALGYLLWRGWQTMTQRRSCGGCDCREKNGPQALVPSDALKRPNSVTEKEARR